MGDFDAREKITLLQFFGHISLNNAPISKSQKLANRRELPLSSYDVLDAFWRSGSLRESAYFGSLGA